MDSSITKTDQVNSRIRWIPETTEFLCGLKICRDLEYLTIAAEMAPRFGDEFRSHNKLAARISDLRRGGEFPKTIEHVKFWFQFSKEEKEHFHNRRYIVTEAKDPSETEQNTILENLDPGLFVDPENADVYNGKMTVQWAIKAMNFEEFRVWSADDKKFLQCLLVPKDDKESEKEFLGASPEVDEWLKVDLADLESKMLKHRSGLRKFTANQIAKQISITVGHGNLHYLTEEEKYCLVYYKDLTKSHSAIAAIMNKRFPDYHWDGERGKNMMAAVNNSIRESPDDAAWYEYPKRNFTQSSS